MINSIESSRAVLFIISDNFTRDKWCHFQLDVARHMYVTEGKPIMIPILLQDISIVVTVHDVTVIETLVRIRQPFILSSFSSPLVYFESDAPSTRINNKTGK
jgi:hypothetical protein